MATTTVLALFKDKRDAEAAVRALKSARFDSARLGVVPPGRSLVPRFGRIAVTGIAAGTIGCGMAGLLLGLVLAWWLHGGWLVPVMFAMTGAATGALAGMLISQSVRANTFDPFGAKLAPDAESKDLFGAKRGAASRVRRSGCGMRAAGGAGCLCQR
jgi:hypothetical protein